MGTYEEFIQNILNTRGRFACGDEYHERHHIVPKCLGGTDEDENLVDLFAREHFEAHRLLALENPENEKLTYAWHMIAIVKDKNQERYQLTPEEYEECKKEYSKKISELMKVRMAGENNPNYHKKLSKEICNKMSESRKGEKNPNYGNKYSDEFKQKISDAIKNSEKFKNRPPISDETRKKISIANTNPSDETRRKMSKAQKGKTISEETRKKISEANKGKFVGENNPNYGRGISVIQLTLNDEFVAEYINFVTAAKVVGISATNIGSVCNHKKGFNTAGGYKWMTKEEYLTQQND